MVVVLFRAGLDSISRLRKALSSELSGIEVRGL